MILPPKTTEGSKEELQNNVTAKTQVIWDTVFTNTHGVISRKTRIFIHTASRN
jgi:hypothetical protein